MVPGPRLPAHIAPTTPTTNACTTTVGWVLSSTPAKLAVWSHCGKLLATQPHLQTPGAGSSTESALLHTHSSAAQGLPCQTAPPPPQGASCLYTTGRTKRHIMTTSTRRGGELVHPPHSPLLMAPTSTQPWTTSLHHPHLPILPKWGLQEDLRYRGNNVIPQKWVHLAAVP